MGITWTGISAARKRLQRIAEGCRAAASGAVLAQAAAAVRAQIDAVAAGRLAKHEATGAAAGSLVVTASGGLVQLTANRYLSFHPWWPFRRGMPPFVVKRAAVILARTLLMALGGKPGAGAEDAQIVVDEADAAAEGAARKAEDRANTRDRNRAAKDRERSDKLAERQSLVRSRKVDRSIKAREGRE